MNYVRPLPYPYQAGVAISNDAEFMSAEFFEGLMAFLNSSGPSPLGVGLGLEVTSSTFFYSAHPYNVSYFEGAEIDGRPAEFAGRLDDYLRAGWIDTLHSYGDFDSVGGFVRLHAERTFETLGRLGVTIPVFTNHGDSANYQNIGGDAPYHRGDLPGEACYHSDLLSAHGTRFIWTDTGVIGDKHAQSRMWRRFLTQAVSPPTPPFMADWQLQDGGTMRRFVRFRGTGANAPNFSSLAYQIDKLDLPGLYRHNGIAVIYQHLGVLHRSGGKCTAATLEAVRGRPEVYLAPWYRLAREVGEGRLWLAGLARLLKYYDMLSSLGVEVGHQGAIRLTSEVPVDDPEEHFQGLTLYVEPAMTPVVTYGERRLLIVHNGPDESGRYSISIPTKKIPNIWH